MSRECDESLIHNQPFCYAAVFQGGSRMRSDMNDMLSAYSEHWAFVKMPGLGGVSLDLARIVSPSLIYRLRSVSFCRCSRHGWTQIRLSVCLIFDWSIYSNSFDW